MTPINLRLGKLEANDRRLKFIERGFQHLLFTLRLFLTCCRGVPDPRLDPEGALGVGEPLVHDHSTNVLRSRLVKGFGQKVPVGFSELDHKNLLAPSCNLIIKTI